MLLKIEDIKALYRVEIYQNKYRQMFYPNIFIRSQDFI